MKHITTVLVLFWAIHSYGQVPNIGLSYTSDSVSAGYTLFSSDFDNDVYLIDNCGRIINYWSFNEQPGLTSYILENGNLLHAGKDSLYIRDWNNNPIWTYAAAANGVLQHHDIEPMPNGNILCIVTETKTDLEQTASGKDPALLSPLVKTDKILELEPIGTDSANITWEWHFWDHIIQEYDPTKLNYGVVADHPELLDLNFDQGNTGDWTHVNGIDYNASLDQIIVSARQFSEIFIIDHSTSTIEAASHLGGNSGHGGDFLWRWGNPQVYQQGLPSDQQLFGQHDPKWIDIGFVNDGKISVFNNGGDGTGTSSSIHLIEPEMNGADYVLTNNTFGPANYFYSWDGNQVSPVMHSDKKSGVQGLSNGNFLICETIGGRFFEIHPDGNVVWLYNCPLGFGGVFNQYDLSANGNNQAFRATKYLPTHPGIALQTLSFGTIIEDQNNVSDNCESNADVSENSLESLLFVNPVVDGRIEFTDPINKGSIQLMDSFGKVLKTWECSVDNHYDVKDLSSGVYLLLLEIDGRSTTRRVSVIN